VSRRSYILRWVAVVIGWLGGGVALCTRNHLALQAVIGYLLLLIAVTLITVRRRGGGRG
jgi:hypothetical protein